MILAWVSRENIVRKRKTMQHDKSDISLKDWLFEILLELAQEDPAFRRRLLVAALGNVEVTRIDKEARAVANE